MNKMNVHTVTEFVVGIKESVWLKKLWLVRISTNSLSNLIFSGGVV